MLYSLISAFLMYSRLPMPQIPWEASNRRYTLCFFPLVGVVIGGLLFTWYAISRILAIPIAIFSIVAVCLPVAVTGGIHLDGFCDVEDAKASFAPISKKLEIMHDPHIGSFAVMQLVLHILLQASFMSIIQDFQTVCIVACGFVVSRAMSGLAAVTFKCAKKKGTLQDFVNPAHKRITVISLLCLLLITSLGMLVISPLAGSVSLFFGFSFMLYYRIFSYRTFGGITGDTEGWFLQKCELWMLIGCTMARWLEVREWF